MKPGVAIVGKADPTRLTAPQRRNFAAAGLLLLGLLALSATLTPSRNGLGTHEQLGLPPCTMQALLGIRCPTCGMTTSWSHLMRGQLAASWQANSGGTCLAVVAAIGGVWAVLAALRGRVAPQIPHGATLTLVILIVVVTALDWGFKVF